jgi:hypothetical protein
MFKRRNSGMFKNNATMKNIFCFLVIALCCIVVSNVLLAEEVHKVGGTKSSSVIKETAAGCAAGTNYQYLDINNVRTLCYSYGNGWFLENAEYEIPKGSGMTSMFSFSLWIGGIDVNNNLKLAAYRYGQGADGGASHAENDFWPGPLNVDGTASVSPETCATYDKLFKMTRAEVQEFLAWRETPGDYPNYTIPKTIVDWPAHGNKAKGQAYYLAPFMDVDGDGTYEPKNGDFPYYDFNNDLCPKKRKSQNEDTIIVKGKIRNGGISDTLGILVDQVLKGDQTLWSVYNDKGNYHSETKGEPIGMEIRAQYFGFATNDEINNMTFYSYELINRSVYTLTGTYFSQWVDPDLGYANDDFVGCDVNRGLGYCYNGTPIDGTGQSFAYGAHPPAVGVDFFQGPYMDADGYDNPSYKGNGYDGPTFNGSCNIVSWDSSLRAMTFKYRTGNGGYRDSTANFWVAAEGINGINFGDGIIDNERFGMRKFVYHDNTGGTSGDYMTDPDYAPEYYLFLRGVWKDNAPMIYGGNAHSGTGGGYGPECNFMFPDESDLCNWGTDGQNPNGLKKWTEVTAGNNPYDRRFMQSAGPFTLLPGACNYITVGIPWARSAGTPEESVALLKQADDKAQSLFDNCFAVLNGPNAPDVTIEELPNALILYLSNRKWNDLGNNYNEKYQEVDPTIRGKDSLYRFEGYQIYQLKDATISTADIYDASKSRLVAQCDVQNGVTKLVNWTYNENISGNSGQVMVTGEDKGIRHSFVFTKDMFATGDDRLINHKQYYYMAVAYGYNQFKKYIPDDPTAFNGQKTPYLMGRSSGGGGEIKVYTGIPHIPLGVIANSAYGDGPVITRIEGQGNGGMILDLSEATIMEILSKPPIDSTIKMGSPDYPIAYNPTYLKSKGPLQVKVIDPLNVVNADFTIKFDSMVDVKDKNQNPFINGITNAKDPSDRILFGKWNLINNTTGITYLPSDTTTIYQYEQTIFKYWKHVNSTDSVLVSDDLGIALTIAQVPNAGDSVRGTLTSTNGLLYASPLLFTDSTRRWLTGVPDNDVPGDAMNWIRSGSYKGPDAGGGDSDYDWDMTYGRDGKPYDPNKNFQKIQTGTWAPYCMTASSMNAEESPVGPAFSRLSKTKSSLANLASVDIVITPEKKYWTRCPVIEMCPDSNLAEGHAKFFGARSTRSVNVDGKAGVVSADPQYNSGYISDTSMGWFPGYAINLETGERLNIMFGENSWLVADNGRDMLWNPSSRISNDALAPVFGGQHYVYIMDHGKYLVQKPMYIDFPAYDAGAYIMKKLATKPYHIYTATVFASAMYVNVPLSVDGQEWLSNPVTTKIRISKPYKRYYSAVPQPGDSLNPVNRNYPMYTFNTSSIATTKYSQEKATSDLDIINVVPNPYFAYDDYERNQLDNRIKIVNLPTKCVVTIFDMSGTLIRQFNVDKSGVILPRGSTSGLNTDAKTSLDWDLKNF